MNKIEYISPVVCRMAFAAGRCLMEGSYGVNGAAGSYDSSQDLIYTDEF